METVEQILQRIESETGSPAAARAALARPRDDDSTLNPPDGQAAEWCNALSFIADAVDWVSRALRHLGERQIEVVMKAVGFPDPVAHFVSRMAVHAALGSALHVLGSVSHALRIAGLALCVAEGRVGECRCARGAVVSLLKEQVVDMGRVLGDDVADRICWDVKRFLARDVSLTEARMVPGSWATYRVSGARFESAGQPPTPSRVKSVPEPDMWPAEQPGGPSPEGDPMSGPGSEPATSTETTPQELSDRGVRPRLPSLRLPGAAAAASAEPQPNADPVPFPPGKCADHTELRSIEPEVSSAEPLDQTRDHDKPSQGDGLEIA
jgi:hypothetical protein